MQETRCYQGFLKGLMGVLPQKIAKNSVFNGVLAFFVLAGLLLSVMNRLSRRTNVILEMLVITVFSCIFERRLCNTTK